MTAQEIFDKVVKHLLTQGRKSIHEKTRTCMYRNTNGDMCAVGALLPDELYHPLFESMAVERLFDEDAFQQQEAKVDTPGEKYLANLAKLNAGKAAAKIKAQAFKAMVGEHQELLEDLQAAHDENGSIAMVGAPVPNLDIPTLKENLKAIAAKYELNTDSIRRHSMAVKYTNGVPHDILPVEADIYMLYALRVAAAMETAAAILCGAGVPMALAREIAMYQVGARYHTGTWFKRIPIFVPMFIWRHTENGKRAWALKRLARAMDVTYGDTVDSWHMKHFNERSPLGWTGQMLNIHADEVEAQLAKKGVKYGHVPKDI